MRYTICVYRDRVGEYRWRLLHRNGKIIADGGEGYTKRSSALRAARRLRIVAAEAEVIVGR